MTGARPKPSGRTSGLYRLATERPIARRTAALAAAAATGIMSGCVRMRQVKPGVVERVVPANDEADRLFTGYYPVGKDFDSADVTIDEHGDRVVLAVDITTSSAGRGGAAADGQEQSFEIELASPRRKRPFVDRDGKPITVAQK
ncbi:MULTISPECIES: hypothetical protein [unclassified Luteococcus]|uniref:hypothetical protein n=1 Tax=unclassified Luteococcus TaxID=2639923 RepID=UPI00313AA926